MKTKQLILGVAPYGRGPNPLAFDPFDAIFDRAIDLNINGGIKYNNSFVDGVVLWGGTDIHPSLYKQKAHALNDTKGNYIPVRDLVEWEILMQATENNIPIIGVCRGAQILCAFAGGSLFQDVTNHRRAHEITTKDGKVFKPAAGHHQMMNLMNLKEGEDYELIAWNSDTRSTHYEEELMLSSCAEMKNLPEPEIVYFKKINAIAIQPHPEWCATNDPFVEYINNLILEKLYTS